MLHFLLLQRFCQLEITFILLNQKWNRKLGKTWQVLERLQTCNCASIQVSYFYLGLWLFHLPHHILCQRSRDRPWQASELFKKTQLPVRMKYSLPCLSFPLQILTSGFCSKKTHLTYNCGNNTVWVNTQWQFLAKTDTEKGSVERSFFSVPSPSLPQSLPCNVYLLNTREKGAWGFPWKTRAAALSDITESRNWALRFWHIA